MWVYRCVWVDSRLSVILYMVILHIPSTTQYIMSNISLRLRGSVLSRGGDGVNRRCWLGCISVLLCSGGGGVQAVRKLFGLGTRLLHEFHDAEKVLLL